MKLTKILALVLALALMVCAFAACGENEPSVEPETTNDNNAGENNTLDAADDITAGIDLEALKLELGDETLVMGTNAEFEPFEYRENDQIVGYDIDTAAEIASFVGLELKVEDMDFDSLITALVSGKVDMVIAGMSIDPERAEVVDFSNPYYSATQVIIVKKDGATVASSEDLAGKKVGVQQGTTGDDYVSEEIEGVDVNRFKKAVDAAIELSNGKLDAVVLDEQPAKRIVEQNEALTILDEALTEEEYAIAVRKNNPVLLKAINDCLAELEENGTKDALLTKYALNVDAE